MHELAITQSVVDVVLERTADRRVTTVRLRSAGCPAWCRTRCEFCFELVTAGTPLEGRDPGDRATRGAARCRTCGDDFTRATT